MAPTYQFAHRFGVFYNAGSPPSINRPGAPTFITMPVNPYHNSVTAPAVPTNLQSSSIRYQNPNLNNFEDPGEFTQQQPALGSAQAPQASQPPAGPPAPGTSSGQLTPGPAQHQIQGTMTEPGPAWVDEVKNMPWGEQEQAILENMHAIVDKYNNKKKKDGGEQK